MSQSYSLTHQDILGILDAALDQPLDADSQAVLDQHLADCAECRRYAASLHKLEARLGEGLQARWPVTPLADSQPASALGNIISHTRRNQMQTRISSSMRTLTLGTLAILLIVALGWGIRTLRPVSLAGGGQTPTTPVGQTPTTPEGQTPTAHVGQTPSAPTPTGRTPSAPTRTPESTSAPTATPQPSLAGSIRLFPKVQFTFATEFPTAPDQVAVYQQQFSEPITIDQARQAAAQLGVSGEVVQFMGEGGGPIYEVHGGGSVVRFLGYADQFVYEVIPNAGLDNPGEFPPFEQQVTIAEAFLREKGLLEGAYRTEPVQTDPGVVRFVQLRDGRPVQNGVGESRMGSPLQWIDVSVTAEGAVSTVFYSAHHFQTLEQYPILTAQQAWERFSASPTGGYGMYAVLSAERASTYRSWVRDYPAGPVHIYGYAASLQSSEGGEALVQFSPYPVTGSVQDMVTGKFLHAWGQIVLDDQGRKTFKVEGWEISTLADTYLSGAIQRQGDTASLQSDDGQWLALPELPADVPAGAKVNLRAVILNGALDWSYIEMGEIPYYYSSVLSCGGGGGGGDGPSDADFGGMALARLALTGMAAVPTQPAPPYQAGDSLDGQIGTVWVTIHKYADYTETEAAMWVEAADGMTFVAYLAGAGLSGIEQYQALPIKVWGRVDKADSSEMYFTVERFEAAYPDLRLQAWLGTEQAVTLEGKDALLFTTLDGQQYVLKSSIGLGDTVRVGLPGDTVILEGVLIPDKIFGGYAVIDERSVGQANWRTDLSGYTITSDQPSIFDHTQDVPVESPANIVQGQVRIEQVELVYLAYALAGCPAEVANYSPEMLYVQPVWRFSGYFEDGRRFEVLVQALPDTCLTFGMPGE